MANKGGAKVRSSSENAGGKFPQGGSGKMFGKGAANPMPAGVTAKQDQGSSNGKFAMGGSGKMFGKGSARKAEPGATAKSAN